MRRCAGFLASLGYDVSVMIRSVPLRGFDTQCAELVLQSVEAEGARVLRGASPLSARTMGSSGRVAVRWRTLDEEDAEGEFDTLLVATGRTAETAALNLEAVGLAAGDDGKLATTHETTAVPHVHAIGDMASEAPDGRPELTPVAIRQGVLLARRLCAEATGGAAEAIAALYMRERAGLETHAIPTAIFTPLEYACVGMSEEEARMALGDEHLEVYHTE